MRRGSHHPRVCTVASFLGLHAPRPLALPVILNVLMIGFSGESGLNVSEARLRPWFEQLQSQLPHAVMPAEAAASERPPPVPSAIEYRYHTRLHVLPPEVPAPTNPNPNPNPSRNPNPNPNPSPNPNPNPKDAEYLLDARVHGGVDYIALSFAQCARGRG